MTTLSYSEHDVSNETENTDVWETKSVKICNQNLYVNFIKQYAVPAPCLGHSLNYSH